MEPPRPQSRDDFKIGLICALPLEAGWAQATFDHVWKDDESDLRKPEDDPVTYTMGVIGGHNVILAHVPSVGKVSTAIVSSNMRLSYPSLRLAFLLGICGGVPCGGKQEDENENGDADDEVPRSNKEIILGDVVISKLLIQYDLGRQYTERWARKDAIEDSLGRPPASVGSLLAKLESFIVREEVEDNMMIHLQALQTKHTGAEYPGLEADKLYRRSYAHKHRTSSSATKCVCLRPGDKACDAALRLSCKELGCCETQLVSRARLENSDRSPPTWKPQIHVGRIGTADTLMSSAKHRDSLAQLDDVIAYEMGGAGIWENIPSLVVRGVCDYADSHNNRSEKWQNYAAAMAACCVKAILQEMAPGERSNYHSTSHRS